MHNRKLFAWKRFATHVDIDVPFPWVPRQDISLTHYQKSCAMVAIGFYHIQLYPGVPGAVSHATKRFYHYLVEVIRSNNDIRMEHV